jgi:hypothetical protein
MVNISFHYDDSGARDLLAKVQALANQKTIPLRDFLTDDFIREHSIFNSLDDLAGASGIEISENTSGDALLDAIATKTTFGTRALMIEAAFAAYTKRKLGL